MHFRFTLRAERRELIAKLRDAFEDCNVDQTQMSFECVSYITVTAARSSDDSYYVVASIAHKTVLSLMITRTQVLNLPTSEARIPLATQVMYLRKLVGFVWGQADFADLIDDLERQQRTTTAGNKPAARL